MNLEFDININNGLVRYTGTSKTVIIPDGVTFIDNFAFYSCETITSITIPDSVTEIGVSAFWSCTNLKKITIPNSVKWIGEYAFQGCTSLVDITIGDCVTEIKDGTFLQCTSLETITIPDNVISIGNSTFADCVSLKKVILPKKLQTISIGVFHGCINLTDIMIPDHIMSIGNIAFCNCQKLTKITIPDGVTSIGNHAFARCRSLHTIVLPENLTFLGNDVFEDSQNIQQIIIHGGRLSNTYALLQRQYSENICAKVIESPSCHEEENTTKEGEFRTKNESWISLNEQLPVSRILEEFDSCKDTISRSVAMQTMAKLINNKKEENVREHETECVCGEEWWEKFVLDAVDALKALPSVSTEPIECEYTVSGKAVEYLLAYYLPKDQYLKAVQDLRHLPSVTPKPKEKV